MHLSFILSCLGAPFLGSALAHAVGMYFQEEPVIDSITLINGGVGLLVITCSILSKIYLSHISFKAAKIRYLALVLAGLALLLILLEAYKLAAGFPGE